MPGNRKKNESKKAKKEGRRESEKKKSTLLCHLQTKTQILRSAHART